MNKSIKLNENAIKGIVRESVKNVLKEITTGGYYAKVNEYLNDALEALEMSDGSLDFEDWYPAFQNELDEKMAQQIWELAIRAYGEKHY
jgi:hypothetical protein